ncbi:gas vesicle protein [Kitasatospora aureofaciens]|uniref:gas vesicle protein n=1 Tax=Kitasatospora aureofaciens TaxID=1894 RepID=UPI0033DA3D8F
MNPPGNTPAATTGTPRSQQQVALIDLLDRLLSGGVVITGDLVLSVADIDLVRVSLRALITSISERTPAPWAAHAPSEEWGTP